MPAPRLSNPLTASALRGRGRLPDPQADARAAAGVPPHRAAHPGARDPVLAGAAADPGRRGPDRADVVAHTHAAAADPARELHRPARELPAALGAVPGAEGDLRHTRDRRAPTARRGHASSPAERRCGPLQHHVRPTHRLVTRENQRSQPQPSAVSIVICQRMSSNCRTRETPGTEMGVGCRRTSSGGRPSGAPPWSCRS